jgi:hypothetical protein
MVIGLAFAATTGGRIAYGAARADILVGHLSAGRQALQLASSLDPGDGALSPSAGREPPDGGRA